MPHADPVNWQSIGEMPLIASMIDGALDDTRDHIETLTKARTRPHVLDDATIDRVERVHNEQLEFVDISPGRSAVGELKARRQIRPATWTGWRNRTGSYEP